MAQLLVAAALFIALLFGPLVLVHRGYRQPSLLYRRPWRACLALAVSALLVVPLGYLCAIGLSALFDGEQAMLLLFAVGWAALFLAAIAAGAAMAQAVRALRGRRG